jgi:ribosomal protein S18 acetylase RimI-like enzyme
MQHFWLALEENIFGLFRAMSILPGYAAAISDRVCYHCAFPDNPMFKGVWRARLPPIETDTAIEAALDWFDQRHAPSILWWTGPQTQPADLAERLLRRGFDGDLVGETGMGIELQHLHEISAPPIDLTIQLATERKTLTDWGTVFASAFDAPVSAGKAWGEATLSAGAHRAPWQLFIGYLDGQPVASSMIFNAAGVVGVYAVGVIPAARGRGLGSAITLRPLLQARALGQRYAVLFASRLGFPVYRRLGFQTLGCQIGIFQYDF